MATVNKDFRIKAGLIVEGTNATVDGEDIITTGSTTDSLPEGTTNLYFTNQRALDAVGGDISTAVSTAINALDTDDIEEGLTNLYFTSQRALDATSSAYDAAGSATTVQGNLEDHASETATHGVTGAIVGTSDIQTLSNKTIDGNLQFGIEGSQIADADGALTVEANGNLSLEANNGDIVLNADGDVYVGSAIASNEVLTQGRLDTYIGDVTVDGSTGNTITDRIATAVSNLVDGAPELLNTLNELAAAINDDESFSSTIATQIGGKQNTLTAGTNISIVSDTISVTGLSSTDISDFSTAALSATASAYDTAGAASAAESAANGYTDTAISGLSSVYEPIGAAATAVGSLTTDDIEEGEENLYFTDARAVDAITTETIYPPAVVINNLSKQVAATQTVGMIATVNGLTWAKSEYKSAKLTVKAKTASHTQLSEILVTLDGSDNVAITEYGIVYTDTELAVVSADVSGTDVRIRVTTVNPSTDITVVGMLIV